MTDFFRVARMIGTIAAREFRTLFLSPLAWGVLAVVQFILAWLFLVQVDTFTDEHAPMFAHMDEGPGVTDLVAAPLFGSAALILLMVVPLLSMRLLAEERRSGTLSLLMSSPVSMTEVVLGKYLGLLGFLMIVVVLVTAMPISLAIGTSLDWGKLAAGALHLEDTGFPWQAGSNVYIAGHRLGYFGTPSWLAFWDLNKVDVGDKVFVTDAMGRRYVYKVFKDFVVDPAAAYVADAAHRVKIEKAALLSLTHDGVPVSGAEMQVFVYLERCGLHGGLPHIGETDELGEYHSSLRRLAGRASYHACVRVRATDLVTGRTGLSERDGVFFGPPPPDTVRVDVVLQ
jgi:hypothetical protein